MHLHNYATRDTVLYKVLYLVYVPTAMYSLLHCTTFLKALFQVFSAFMILTLPIFRDELGPSRRQKLERPFRCSDDLGKNVGNLSFVFRSFQLIGKDVSEIVGPFIPLLHSMFGQLAISVGYTLIVGGDSVDGMTTMLFVGLLGTAGFWICVIDAGARLPKASGKALIAWKTEAHLYWDSGQDRRYMGKFRKSCKPICIGYSGYIMITHRTVLKFVQGVIRGTFRIILTFKKK